MSGEIVDQSLADERFRLAVEACPNGMVMIDDSGKMVMVNSKLEQQFGYCREELLGQPLDILIPARLRSEYRRQRAAFKQEPRICRIGGDPDLIGLRKNGSEFSVEIGLTPICGCDAPLTLGLVVDITDRQNAQKHLADMESRYRSLLDAAPDAMVVVSQSQEIVLLNLQAEKQFGYRRDELLGKSVDTIIPEGFSELLLADTPRSVEDIVTQQAGAGIELYGRRKNGSEFPIEIMLSPLESAEGKVVTAAIRDISVRKRVDRLKAEFVSTVSHELRTPLTAISGSLGLLMGQAGGVLPEAAIRLLAIANTNSDRLVCLINDILDIEKMESGRIVFHLSRVDVNLLVAQTIETNRVLAERSGISIRYCPAHFSGFSVNADPDRFAQVITNLLSNAIKFSSSGQEVVVVTERNGEVIRISVRDYGPGIAEDFRPHLFDKFAQADATASRRNGGTGLGLSIVKQIVERHDGRVGCTDAPGGGTIFYVDLPVWNDVAGVETDFEAPPGCARILLCEDDRETALAMREKLRPAGFAADFAYTAAAARAHAEANRYAAVLVDLQLPDGDGISLILRLRAQARYHDTPIIVISVDPTRGRDDERSSRLNVLGWLKKPVDFAHLVQTLRASIASS